MLKKHPWKIIIGVAVVLMAGAFYWSSTAGEQANVGVEVKDHIKGNPDATVKLVEYSDFQCPACGQFYPVIKDVMDEYGDSISFEYKHFPLVSIHPFAVPAAKAAEAAGQQGKFFEMHDKLFENQQAWSNAVSPQAYFVSYAEDIGLDVDQFKTQMRASVLEDRIESDFNEARERGLTGTPSFFLNGQRMQYETIQDFLTQIEQAVNGTSAAGTTTPETDDSASATSEVRFGL